MQNPISLYIHIPWCVRKCPYCDFNSHKKSEEINEIAYINALTQDLEEDLQRFNISAANLQTIFIGGGTPSLFSASSLEKLVQKIKTFFAFRPDIEITLEANPGTVERERFSEYFAIGINRISLGVQSFNDKHLKILGRIHSSNEAHLAIDCIYAAGFKNFNLDIMYALPQQTLEEGLNDLNVALSKNPPHLSWYQLTIEPNTIFHKKPPQLPNELIIDKLEQQAYSLLKEKNFTRYEISAYSQPQKQAQHNMNYWQFGDYLGIGAGAHGKWTDKLSNKIMRARKRRQPGDFLNPSKSFLAEQWEVHTQDRIFEFMLNATRLELDIAYDLFTQTTLLPIDLLMPLLEKARAQKLITMSDKNWTVTPLGRKYTNNLQEIFLTN